MIQLSWTELKNQAVLRKSGLHYVERDTYYKIFLVDGNFCAETILKKTDPANTDQQDFEDNYKDEANKPLEPVDSDGIPVSAPSFEYDFDLDGYFQGYLYTASAGVTSIFDELITTEIKLRAGWYEILDNNAVIGDYIDFSVVDKDDVLGLFGALGLTQGVDVLEVGNFVRTEYINPRNTGRSDFRVDGASTVFAGLYFRVKYVSTGANDVDFKASYLVYED